MLWNRRYRPKSAAEHQKQWEKLPLEKGDVPAMLMAALATLLPAVLLVGGLFALALWLLFLR